MCDNHGDPFIATVHNLLLAPKLCNRLSSIIVSMDSGHNCFFHKGVCTVYFGARDNNAVTLPHSAQRKHEFLEKNMVILENRDIIIVQEGWQNTRIFYCTRVLYDSIITLINSEHSCLFHKVFCTVYFGEKENNAVTLPHSAQRRHTFLGNRKF